jgi:LSD1 subclass zinc finger protein
MVLSGSRHIRCSCALDVPWQAVNYLIGGYQRIHFGTWAPELESRKSSWLDHCDAPKCLVHIWPVTWLVSITRVGDGVRGVR